MKRAGFGANVTKLAKPLVAASLEVYETIQRELLPTPTKSHYTFNLRDVSKVIQVLPSHKWNPARLLPPPQSGPRSLVHVLYLLPI